MARLKVKQRSQNDVAHLHPSTNVPTTYKLQRFNISEIQHQQDFKVWGHYSMVKGQIKVTPQYCTLQSPKECPHNA